MSKKTTSAILFQGDTRNAIGTIDLLDSVMKDLVLFPERLVITPLITGIPKSYKIEGWSLNVVQASSERVIYKELKAPGVSRIIDDPRPITKITFPFQESSDLGLTIGCKLFGQEVTKIVAYEEPGEMGPVTWYAIYGRKPEYEGSSIKEVVFGEGITIKREELIYRIQAKYVESIGYQEEKAK